MCLDRRQLEFSRKFGIGQSRGFVKGAPRDARARQRRRRDGRTAAIGLESAITYDTAFVNLDLNARQGARVDGPRDSCAYARVERIEGAHIPWMPVVIEHGCTVSLGHFNRRWPLP